MYLERKYRRIDWFTFLDLINEKINTNDKAPDLQELFDITYELEMRKLECISEGGVWKYKKAAQMLIDYLTKQNIDNHELKALLNTI